MKFWERAAAIVWKDILSEMRTKESLSSVLVFTLLVLVIFNFAFDPGPETISLVAPGILWVAFAFSGVLVLNRSFSVEREDGCMEGLLACPVSREVILAGKAAASLVFLIVVEAVTIPVFALFFNRAVASLEFFAITGLTSVGFIAVGTLFSAMAVNTRARELVLPILFLPVASPLVICAVNASALALAGQSWADIATWLQMIVAFDIIFATASFMVFSYVVEE